MVGCDISSWGCLTYCSGDVFIFFFKENFCGSLCHQGPSEAPGNIILSKEQRGKFAADQMQKHHERRRRLGVTDDTVPGPVWICVFCRDLRAVNSGESTHSSGCVAVWGVGGEDVPLTLLKTLPCHEEVGGAQHLQTGPAQMERTAKDGVRGWSVLSYGDSVTAVAACM